RSYLRAGQRRSHLGNAAGPACDPSNARQPQGDETWDHRGHQEAARLGVRFQMRAYPATLTPDPDGGFTVTFRDVPEAITEGDTRDEALLRAEDALESALAMYIAAKEPLPASSEPGVGERMVALSALGMAKTALYDAMREQGVGRAELARR